MRIYELIEITIKKDFESKEFTITDIKKHLFNNQRLSIEQSYISKLFKQLLHKKYIKLLRVEDEHKGFFAKRIYRLNNKDKWEEVFK